jgi:hypothetical protein
VKDLIVLGSIVVGLTVAAAVAAVSPGVKMPLVSARQSKPANTKGKITNFSAANNATWQIDGKDVTNQNANKSWSLKKIDDYTLRFEVRSGDVWYNTSGGHDNTTNRNEVADGKDGGSTVTYPEGETLQLSETITIEPGPKNTSSWCDLTQLHATTDTPPSPFVIQLSREDKLEVVLQKPPSTNLYVYKTPNPITRGKPINVRAAVKMGPSGNGKVEVWFDDAKVVDYSGAVGATNSRYSWKFGLYRGETPETLSAVFRNVSLTGP